MFFADAVIVGTLVEVLVILLASLTLVIFVVLHPVFLRVEYLQLYLINEPRCWLIKPSIKAFLIFTFVINNCLRVGQLALPKQHLVGLGLCLVCTNFASGHQILVLLEQQQLYFRECVRRVQTVIDLFLFEVARMRFELLASHRVIIEVVHLRDVEAASRVVVAILAVAALQTNHVALLAQMPPHFFVSVLVLGCAKAFVLITGALATFSMSFKLRNSVHIDFLKTGAAMTNLDSVNDVLQNF